MNSFFFFFFSDFQNKKLYHLLFQLKKERNTGGKKIESLC